MSGLASAVTSVFKKSKAPTINIPEPRKPTRRRLSEGQRDDAARRLVRKKASKRKGRRSTILSDNLEKNLTGSSGRSLGN